MQVVHLKTPINDDDIKDLVVGDQIEISGRILCGRDAVLPCWMAQGSWGFRVCPRQAPGSAGTYQAGT